MCRLIIILKTRRRRLLLLSLVLYGVNAKIMKKFKVRLITFLDCRTVRQVFDKKEAIFFKGKLSIISLLRESHYFIRESHQTEREISLIL